MGARTTVVTTAAEAGVLEMQMAFTHPAATIKSTDGVEERFRAKMIREETIGHRSAGLWIRSPAAGRAASPRVFCFSRS